MRGGRPFAVNEAAVQLKGAAAPSVEILKRELVRLIEQGTDAEVQVEASRLLICATELREPPDAGEVALLESGVAALSGNSGNVRVAKFVRNRLDIARRNRGRGFMPALSRVLGDSAVYPMLVGAMVSAFIWAVGFGAVMFIGGHLNVVLQTDFILPPREASPLAFAAAIGGLVSLLSRVNQFASLYIFDPILVFVNSLLKPLLASLLALTAYAVLKSGVVQVSGLTLDHVDGEPRFIFWAFGFVAGFSERLAGDFIARAESVIGRPAEDKPSRRAPSVHTDAG